MIDVCTFCACFLRRKLTRTHTCHLRSRRTASEWYVPLEKTYRRCCRFLTYTGFASGFGPQEPRRPRFPFFHLHNVKELTSGPVAGRRRWKRCFLILRDKELIPVARQHLCPFKISAISETGAAGRLGLKRWRCIWPGLFAVNTPK